VETCELSVVSCLQGTVWIEHGSQLTLMIVWVRRTLLQVSCSGNACSTKLIFFDEVIHNKRGGGDTVLLNQLMSLWIDKEYSYSECWLFHVFLMDKEIKQSWEVILVDEMKYGMSIFPTFVGVLWWGGGILSSRGEVVLDFFSTGWVFHLERFHLQKWSPKKISGISIPSSSYFLRSQRITAEDKWDEKKTS